MLLLRRTEIFKTDFRNYKIASFTLDCDRLLNITDEEILKTHGIGPVKLKEVNELRTNLITLLGL